MSAKKINSLTADEEIERDYRKYKEQFEQWKEQNRNAIGTDAYNKYVQQFEAWEKDVETRRADAKRRNEKEKTVSENDDVAAKAYAQEQQQYLRMHQRGIADDAIRNRLSGNLLKPAIHNSPRNTPGKVPVENDMVSLMSAMQTVIQSAIKSDIRSPGEALKPVSQNQSATISAPPIMKAQQTPLPMVQQPTVPKQVQLWWTRQAEYGSHDRLFRTFGPRAAPTTTKQAISDSYDYYVPGWLVQRDMAKNALIFPNPTLRPALLPHPSTTDAPKKLPSLLTMDIPIPADFTVPPPNFHVTKEIPIQHDFTVPPPNFRPFLPLKTF